MPSKGASHPSTKQLPGGDREQRGALKLGLSPGHPRDRAGREKQPQADGKSRVLTRRPCWWDLTPRTSGALTYNTSQRR